MEKIASIILIVITKNKMNIAVLGQSFQTEEDKEGGGGG